MKDEVEKILINAEILFREDSLKPSISRELELTDILIEYGQARHQALKGDMSVKEHAEAWQEAKAKLLELIKLLELMLSCRPDRADESGDTESEYDYWRGYNAAIDTIEQQMRAKFQ